MPTFRCAVAPLACMALALTGACSSTGSGTTLDRSASDAGSQDVRVPGMPVATPGDAVATLSPNLSCLGKPSPMTPTTAALPATATIDDYETGAPVAGATLALYGAATLTGSPVATCTADATGACSFTVPSGTQYLHFKLSAPCYADTAYVYITFDPTVSPLTFTTAILAKIGLDALPAYAHVTRTAGTAAYAAQLVDCAGAPIENGVAEVRDTTDHPVGGASIFYFDAATPPLPTPLSKQAYTNVNGLLGAVNVATGPSLVRLEAFGVTGAGSLTRLSSVPVPVLPDTLIITQLPPYTVP